MAQDRLVPHFPPAFDPDDPMLLSYLEEHGYAVIRSVASPSEVASLHDEFWAWIEAIPNAARRYEPSTWEHGLGANPATGILGGFGFGQSKFLWGCRTLPRVRASFEAIWGTSDLLTSFDGGNVFRPTHSRPEWRTCGGWWHCDQNAMRPDRSGRVCVQGLVLLTPANKWTGGLCVIPGSHLYHEEFSQRHPWAATQGDFLVAARDDPVLDVGEHLLLCANAGDMLLWDSRIIHCNSPGLDPVSSAPEDAVPPEDELLRLVGYVCCTPTSMSSSEVRLHRAVAALELTSTTHWPQAFVQAGGDAPSWMKRRTPMDYSPEETRLILGNEGKWPAALMHECDDGNQVSAQLEPDSRGTKRKAAGSTTSKKTATSSAWARLKMVILKLPQKYLAVTDAD
ncbi:hypothetical protein AB1Y20_004038 [Prymnesium parvum]|uniref:Phytanoyl-CoA dioxygenase n=1 Tax=Prymnesium parvum TaxID=97485 RepID=A0AB34J6Q1_PRYPA